ncbi:MAG: EAL domain-containing protein, partial [Burkholderiales bacterium]
MHSEIVSARYAPETRNHALLANLVLAAAYALAAWVGLAFAGTPPALWPASGVALAGVVYGGTRVLPGIALGAAAVALWTSKNLLVTVGVAAGSVFEAWLAVYLLRQVPHFQASLGTMRSVLALTGVSLVAPLARALIGVLGLNAAGQVETGGLSQLIWQWWTGGILGILVAAPPILAWSNNFRIDLSTHRARFPVWVLLALAIVAFGVMDGRLKWMLGDTPGYFLIVPIAILIALGEDIRLAALANLVVAGFVLWGLSSGHGPFPKHALNPLQLFLAVVSIATLFVAALSSGRALALRESQRNLARFRGLTALSADWYWETDAEHRFTFLSEGYEQRSGLLASDTLGYTRGGMQANAFESEAIRQQHLQALRSRSAFHDLILRRVRADGKMRWASVSGEPIFSATGNFSGYRGVGHDITAQKQNVLKIEESQRFLDALINAIATPVLVKDESHRYVAANTAFSQFFSRPLDQVLGKDDYDFFEPAKAQYFQRTDDEALANGHVEYESAYPIGEKLHWMFVRKSLLKLPGGAKMIVLIMLDVTERRAAESRVKDSERRFMDFAQAAGDYAFEVDLEGRFTYCSARSGTIWGYAPEELVSRTPGEFMPPEEVVRVREWFSENLREDGSFRDLQHQVTTKHGEQRWMLVNAVGVFDSEGKRIGHRGSGRDITDRKTVEDRINFLATRDALTGLPNRVLFGDRIAQAIAASRRTGQGLAVFFMDLDRFKYINDTLGHDVGDILLKQVAERMLACVRKRDTLARLGGDEFVLALEGLLQPEDAAQVATKIVRSIAEPYEISGHSLTTSCSIGISIFPSDAEDERTLMKNADTAMYHAKERGRNNFQFFSHDMNTRAVERNQLEAALRQSLENADFILHYQPKVAIRTLKVTGVEALLRWNHPTRGLVTPSFFMDVAQDSGLIEPLGEWALREACMCAKRWELSGYPALNIAVNVSARQLGKPAEFARRVSRIFAETGFDPRRMELEITESLLLHNTDEIVARLRKLARAGPRISVDDFGTGFSSLSYLRQFPIHCVKIDRTFVRDVDTNAEHESVIQAIVAMAHSLNLVVTAEGVESLAQLEALKRLGCDDYQGNLFSKALPAIDIAAKFLAP